MSDVCVTNSQMKDEFAALSGLKTSADPVMCTQTYFQQTHPGYMHTHDSLHTHAYHKQ